MPTAAALGYTEQGDTGNVRVEQPAPVAVSARADDKVTATPNALASQPEPTASATAAPKPPSSILPQAGAAGRSPTPLLPGSPEPYPERSHDPANTPTAFRPRPAEHESDRRPMGASLTRSRPTVPTSVRETHIDPANRAGRPRQASPPRPRPSAERLRERHARPEVICWKSGRQWVPGVEAPEELLEGAELTLTQEGTALNPDGQQPGCWPLRQLSGTVIATWHDDERRTATLPCGDGSFLLFRLNGQQDYGRLVSAPTSGEHLVTAPADWTRDEHLSGSPPIRPEAVALSGCRAHFFNVERTGTSIIAFRTASGTLVKIEPATRRFELVGQQVVDGSVRMGTLFVGGPPVIRALDDRLWDEVRTLVVGAEGHGRDGWRHASYPIRRRRDHPLPGALAERGGGWYFLRFYDARDRLIDSVDFRFTVVLTAITVDSPPLLPPAAGHNPVTIRFRHQPGASIQSIDRHVDVLPPRLSEHETIVTLPARPAYDISRWSINHDDTLTTPVTVQIERIWWTLGEIGHEPNDWTDLPVELGRAHVSAESTAALWVRLPAAGWAATVLAGFARTRARSYHVPATAQVIAIPLRHFGDAREARTSGVTPLHVWVQVGDEERSATFGQLVIQLHCQQCDFATQDESEYLAHLKERHLRTLLPELTYDEMRRRRPNLPATIYRCGYCVYYTPSGGIQNPTSTIDEHFNQKHRNRGNLRFKVIDDTDTIRQYVIKDLVVVHWCQLCKQEWEQPTEKELLRHLLDNHRAQLYELR